MDYKRNAKYFCPTQWRAGVAYIFTLLPVASFLGIFLAIDKPNAPGHPALGVLVGLLGIVLAIAIGRWAFSVPTDAEIDQQAASFLHNIKDAALKKLGLDAEEVSIAPGLEFWGYSFDQTLIENEQILTLEDVKGKDGLWRAPIVACHVFLFSENMIHYYYKFFSLVNYIHEEGTEEYYYKDVVSVKTESVTINRGEGVKKKQIKHNTFALRNTGGESLSCSVLSSKEAEAAVTAMRALLRIKKLA